MSLPFSKKRHVLAVAAGLALMPGVAVKAAESGASGSGGGLEEVVVTVQRRQETVQNTPVSVAVLSSADLDRQGIKEVRDLTASVPGVNLSLSAIGFNNVFSIRGMSRGTTGNNQPAVGTYVNEVPLPFYGSSVPTYDVGTIQVLKGPQGTLFGRNTTAGAVLISTKEPSYEMGGYLQATVGSYSWNQEEGAFNLPLIKDKIAVRFAAQRARRDGYTKNMSGGPDFDDMHRDNARISLLVDPFEGLSNLSVYEHNSTNETGGGVVFYQYTQGETTDYLCFLYGGPGCAVPAAAARQQAAGPRKTWSNVVDPSLTGQVNSFSNTTTFELDTVTVKNIFGWRKSTFKSATNLDGLDLPLVDAYPRVGNEQRTDEFQISGSALNDTLTYITGYFYSDVKPDGPQHQLLQLFGGPIAGSGDYYFDTSHAVFAQGSYELSGITDALEDFSVDAGVRHTRDETRVCSVEGLTLSSPDIGRDQCASTPGASEASGKFSKTTYTLGLNYKPTYNVLIYAVGRTGYRAGGVNAPKFGGSLVPFQTFAPETVKDVELGLKSQWAIGGVDGRFNMAVFRSRYSDLQAAIPTTSSTDPDGDGNPLDDPSSTSLYASVGTATVQGAEAELTLVPVRDLEITLGGSWLDKSIDKVSLTALGNLSPSVFDKAGLEKSVFYGAPDYAYTAAVRYTLPLPTDIGNVSLSTHYYTAAAVDYNAVRAPGAKKLDVRVDWTGILQSGFDVSLFATNVTDETYPVGGSLSGIGVGATSVIYNEPRMVGAQLKYSFGAK